MKTITFKDSVEVSEAVAAEIIKIVNQKPNAVICIAGGDTPLPVMQELIREADQKKVDFSKAYFVGLDEWVGLGKETKGSCIQTLQDNLYGPLGLREEQIIFFDGKTSDLEKELDRINTFIAKNGLDFILLGIGMNGHIGFNEPGVKIDSEAQVVALDEVTTTVMTKYFDEQLPLTEGITLGFKQILAAKNIVLMATGVKKAEIVKKTVKTEPTNQLPATVLKLAEKEADFYLDEAAASLLEEE